jgi:hypothetical protein
MRFRVVVCSALWLSMMVAQDAATQEAASQTTAQETAPLGTYTAAERRHWAFQKRSNPAVPSFTEAADQAWVKNPVDAFVLARLKKEGLQPSPRADRATLIRRLYFDVTGLPPTPIEIDAFATDHSPDAYDKLVERLLASPQYGERWAQHWLDVVRFAETEGYEYDTHRNNSWRYRDYVIRAFNTDKPYDQFVFEQIAGDEVSPLDDPNDEALIAAGFVRLGPVQRQNGDLKNPFDPNAVLTDWTDIVGSAMLGVTLGCARCHDHKFDPIRQSDYYRMQAFYTRVSDNDVVKAPPEEVAAWQSTVEPLEKEMNQIRRAQRKLRDKPEAADELAKLTEQLEALQEKMPPPLPSLFSIRNDPEKTKLTHILVGGNPDIEGLPVRPRPLGLFLPEGTPELPADTSNPRTKLAEWLIDPDHPLTARVMVNRIWHYHFGQGIVATPNDFGNMGFLPTHPELLDYLANEFVATGFRMKHVHRLILNSNTYQQSSAGPEDSAMLALANEKDPANELLWRFNRKRLEAEQIRDAILAASGELNPEMGGPSVMVPVSPELVAALYKPRQWVVNRDPEDHNRRSIYLISKRNLRLPIMEAFDQADGLLSCAKRESATHAPQSLELLNGDFANQQADAFAERLLADAGSDPSQQVDLAYRLVTGNAPNPEEMAVGVEFLKNQPLKRFALAMFNLNAFLYVN